jgi:hypothetical protein
MVTVPSEAFGRAEVTGRSQGRCELCGRNRAAHWHHRCNRSQGGSWSPANGLHLCPPCHHRVTVEPRWAYAEGLLVPEGQDPATVPVRLEHPVYLAWWYLLDHDGGLRFAEPYSTPTAEMTGLTAQERP